MAFDPRFVIDVIYPAANSSYMIMTVPEPPLGAGYELAGAIEADPRRAPASPPTTSAPRTTTNPSPPSGERAG